MLCTACGLLCAHPLHGPSSHLLLVTAVCRSLLVLLVMLLFGLLVACMPAPLLHVIDKGLQRLNLHARCRLHGKAGFSFAVADACGCGAALPVLACTAPRRVPALFAFRRPCGSAGNVRRLRLSHLCVQQARWEDSGER